MKNQVGQLFFIGIQGTELTRQEADFIVNNNITGVTLFSRNVESPQQLHKLCSDIHALSQRMPEKAPMLIAIDNEGGRVQRLKPPFTQWPAVKKLGELDSTSLSFKFANFMGLEMKSVGINVDFAPCVDLATNKDNQVIGDRSLGVDPEIVSKLASALVRGFIKAGILPCAKHFPGHGNTFADSHEELPTEEMDLPTLEARELIPFKKTFRARLDLVMTAHIKYPNIDPDWPVTLSPKFLKDIMRGQLRYRNLVISDDLDMKALTNHYERNIIPVQALKAGCDLLLYCNEPESPPIALEAVHKALESGELDKAQIQESYTKMMQLKKTKFADFEIPSMDEASKIIGHPEHVRLSKAIADGEVPEDLLTT